MANIQAVRRKPVTIDIGDGVQRSLRFTLNAFAELEEKYGDIDTALEMMEKGSVKAIRFVLWAGLSADDEEITEKYVGSNIEIPDLERIAEGLNKALAQDMPKEVKKNPN